MTGIDKSYPIAFIGPQDYPHIRDELIRWGNTVARAPTVGMLSLLAFDKAKGRAW